MQTFQASGGMIPWVLVPQDGLVKTSFLEVWNLFVYQAEYSLTREVHEI